MSYADRSEEAQQEQLDWLAQIAEESRAQTALLRNMSRHTGLIYALAIIWLVCLAIYLLVQLFG